MSEILAAQFLMISRIGSPVSTPAILQVKLATHDALPVTHFKQRVEEIAADRLAGIPKLIDEFTAGLFEVY